jgi:Tfp pilus assembly protein PilF
MALTTEELENLAALLASPVYENVALGMELIKQHLEHSKDLLAPLMLIRHFMEDYEAEELEQWQAEVGVLLNTYIDAKTIKKYDQHFSVFQWVRQHFSKRWTEFQRYLMLFEEHFEIYEPYILDNANYLQRYHELAEYLRRQYKKPAYAFPYMKKVMRLRPEDPNLKIAYVDLMINSLFLKNLYLEETNRVIQELEDLAKIYPSYAYQYYHLIGIVYDIYVIDKEEAKKYYHQCLDLYPAHESSMNNLANILYKFDGDYDAARKLARKAVELEQDIHHLDTLACIEFYGYGRIEKAKSLLEELMLISMKHHPSLTLMGELMEAKGQYGEARIWYERGLKLKSNSEYKLIQLTELLFFKLNDWEESLSCVRKLLKYHPNNSYGKMLKRRILEKNRLNKQK